MQRIYKPQLRLQALDGGPLRGGDGYQFGFYDAGIMRQILDHFGGGYKVWTLPVPNTDKEFKYAQKLVNRSSVLYSLVDKDKIVYVTVDNCPDWMSALTQLGYEVHSGDKTNKRLKSAHRPTLLNATFGVNELNVLIVESDSYSRYDFTGDEINVPDEYADPSVYERLLDGGFVISKRLVQRAVENLPVYDPENSTDTSDYYYDPRVRRKIVQDLLNSKTLNARIIFDKGFLKGNCFVVDLPGDIDIITSEANIKNEITYNQGFQFLAEPQGPKSRVITDDQTVINFPKLFRKSDMDMWLTEEYKKLYQEATSGNLLTNWKYIYQRNWKDTNTLDDNEARARMAYVGYRWTAAGFSVTESPWLMETVSISHARPLENRIPIPCSVYEQIVPESLVRMAGYYDFEVNQGDIKRLTDLGVHVVNDIDWLEMYESHGGHDEDDFFKLFYREFEGGPIQGKKVLVARSPNGYGEYSIFNYVEGEWSPAWFMADGTEVRFPKVNGRNWPKRLSEATSEGYVRYSGLPSSHSPKVKRTGPYSQDDVIRDIKIAMAGGNVGGFVNAAMLHSSVVAKHRSVQLCSLEDAIDKCINPDHELDVLAIDTEASTIVQEVVSSGKPIDRNLWNNRGSTRYLKVGQTVELYEGKITQMNNLCYSHYSDYVYKIRQWTQENSRPSDIIHTLGQRFYSWALPVLRNFRMGLYNTNSSQDTISAGVIQRNRWEQLYSDLVDRINSFERIEDRNDFVISLYSATIQVPTSKGKITDQIVMNRLVFPYLEEALQFYGIANIPMYRIVNNDVKIELTKNDSWWWPASDGSIISYTDPYEFQKAHSMDSPIDFRMSKPKTNA